MAIYLGFRESNETESARLIFMHTDDFFLKYFLWQMDIPHVISSWTDVLILLFVQNSFFVRNSLKCLLKHFIISLSKHLQLFFCLSHQHLPWINHVRSHGVCFKCFRTNMTRSSSGCLHEVLKPELPSVEMILDNKINF